MKPYLFLILLSAFLLSCNNQTSDKQSNTESPKNMTDNNLVVGIGKISPEQDIIQLSSPVNGIVEKIYKKENDSVSIGTVILELEHSLEDAKITQLNNQLATQQAQIRADEANVADYVAKVKNAQAEFQRLQSLLAKGAETQQTLDNAATNLKSLNANIDRLQATVSVSKSRLNETRATIETAQLERRQKIIQSPVSGRILELTTLIGGSIAIQQSFGQISPEGNLIAICEIDELYADKIKVGQKGWIRTVGSVDTLSKGTVYFASSFLKKKSLFTDQAGEKEDRRVRTIKIMLDQAEHLLLNKRVECIVDVSNNPKK